MAWFYILYSTELDRYYVGHTEHTVEDRLRKHLGDHSAWTSRAKDWIIALREEYPDKGQAMRREREVKKWKSRKRIEILCKPS